MAEMIIFLINFFYTHKFDIKLHQCTQVYTTLSARFSTDTEFLFKSSQWWLSDSSFSPWTSLSLLNLSSSLLKSLFSLLDLSVSSIPIEFPNSELASILSELALILSELWPSCISLCSSVTWLNTKLTVLCWLKDPKNCHHILSSWTNDLSPEAQMFVVMWWMEFLEFKKNAVYLPFLFAERLWVWLTLRYLPTRSFVLPVFTSREINVVCNVWRLSRFRRELR